MRSSSREGVVGDGVEHMFTTSAGDIWVAYFDEGVFGNYGWGGPGPTPIGAPGIVRFGADLSLRWSFPMNTSMADCYAFNVDDHEIWACYYTEFPIARIADDAVRHWTNAAARGPSTGTCPEAGAPRPTRTYRGSSSRSASATASTPKP